MVDPRTEILGQSVLGRDIKRKIFSKTTGNKHLLIIAGVHGDEAEGLHLVKQFEAMCLTADQHPCHIHLIPCLNVDGVHASTRVNARGVDLNRNLPTQDWGGIGHDRVHENDVPADHEARYFPGHRPASEPENQILQKIIEERMWHAVISIHSYRHPMVNYNGGHSQAVAAEIANVCGLPAKDDIGYPTPGSLGTWVGVEKKVPCITLELKRGMTATCDYTPFVNGLWQACKWIARVG